MEAIRNFLRIFYDLSAYRSIVNFSLKRTLLTALLFYLTVGLLTGLGFYFWGLPLIETYATRVASITQASINKEAEFNVNKGLLTSRNVTQPLKFQLPPFPGTDKPVHIMIDTNQDLTALASASATVALGNNGLRVYDPITQSHYVDKYATEGGELSTTVRGIDIHDTLDGLTAFLADEKGFIAGIIGLSAALALLIMRLAATTLYSFLFWIGSQVFNRSYSWKAFFNILLHTGIVADVVGIILLLIYRQPHQGIAQLAFGVLSLAVYLSLPVQRKST